MLDFLAWQTIKKYKPIVVAVLAKDADFNPTPAITNVISKGFTVSKSYFEIKDVSDLFACILDTEKDASYASKLSAALSMVTKRNTKYPEVLVLTIPSQKTLEMIKGYSSFFKFDFIVVLPQGIGKDSFDAKNFKDFIRPATKFIIKSSDKLVIDSLVKKKYKVLTYASRGADIFASDVMLQSNGGLKNAARCGISFKVNFKGSLLPVRISRSINEKEICNCLIAILIGLEMKINLVKITSSFMDYKPVSGMKVVDGIKRSVIIDNSSNHSFESALEVLDGFGKLKSNRKVVVVGDIIGLGFEAEKRHREIAQKIYSQKPDLIFCVGNRVTFIYDELVKLRYPEDRIYKFDDVRDVEKLLQPKIKEDDLILISGSQALGLGQVLRQIMANPPLD